MRIKTHKKKGEEKRKKPCWTNWEDSKDVGETLYPLLKPFWCRLSEGHWWDGWNDKSKCFYIFSISFGLCLIKRNDPHYCFTWPRGYPSILGRRTLNFFLCQWSPSHFLFYENSTHLRSILSVCSVCLWCETCEILSSNF